MGGGAALYTAFSDRRLKADIVKVGDDPRGFGVYEFCYATDPSRRYRGVMADELQQRSEERRVGKEYVSTCRSRWSTVHQQENKSQNRHTTQTRNTERRKTKKN